MLNIDADGSVIVSIIASGYRVARMPLSIWLLLTREAKSMRQLTKAVDEYAASEPLAMTAGGGR